MQDNTSRQVNSRRWRGTQAVLTVLCCLLLAACGGLGEDDDPSPMPTPSPTSLPVQEPTTAVTTPLEISAPIWATGVNPEDGSPVDQVEWFPTDAPVIYAVFQTSDIAVGTSFMVNWKMNGTPVPGLNPTLHMNADAPPGWIEFHLTRTSDAVWPDGELEVLLTVDGELVSQGSVSLRDP